MLKPKTLNPKLQTCHQFILLEQINFAKVNKIRKVTNQLPNEQVDVETEEIVKRLGSYI